MKSTNRIIEISKAQAFHFQSMNFANATKQGIKAPERTIVYHTGNFYMALMEIGTTSYSALLLVDTGSNTIHGFKVKDALTVSP